MGKCLCFGKKKKPTRADKLRKDAKETADLIVTSAEAVATVIENYEFAKEKSGEIYEAGAKKAKEYEKEGKKAVEAGSKAVSDYASSTANTLYDNYTYYTTPAPEPTPTKPTKTPKK